MIRNEPRCDRQHHSRDDAFVSIHAVPLPTSESSSYVTPVGWRTLRWRLQDIAASPSRLVSRETSAPHYFAALDFFVAHGARGTWVYLDFHR